MGIENEVLTAMETEQEGFKIDNDFRASWALKIIKEEDAEAARLQLMADQQIEELVNKKMEIKERFERRTGYLKKLLYDYFVTAPLKETKTQLSYKLLDGTLTWKKPCMKIMRPEDDTALIGYLEQNQPEMVETVKKVAWGELKKNLTITDDGGVVDMATGEKLDFIQTEEEPGKFDVKVV